MAVGFHIYYILMLDFLDRLRSAGFLSGQNQLRGNYAAWHLQFINAILCFVF